MLCSPNILLNHAPPHHILKQDESCAVLQKLLHHAYEVFGIEKLESPCSGICLSLFESVESARRLIFCLHFWWTRVELSPEG